MSSSLVKSMINVYENFSYTNVNSEPAKLTKVHRTKSTGSINTAFRRPRELSRREPQTNLELVQIEQQVQHLANTLNNYKSYNRENHIYYQNQIFFLLTDIINIDARDDPHTINKKTEVIETLKRLNVGLNARLPSANHNKEKYVELPPPVVKHVKKVEEKQVVSKLPKQNSVEHVTKNVPKQDSVDNAEEREDEDAPAPSVKSLKQLWEKNISENEKKKAKENESKLTQSVLKLDMSPEIRYIPYSERFQKENSFDIPSDLYEKSVQARDYSLDLDDEEEINRSPDSLSHHSEENSDDGSGQYQVNENDLEDS